MVESAAHLVDHAFPDAPVRQWVLTFPFPVRFLLAARPQALTAVLAVVQRSISSFVIRRSGLRYRIAIGPHAGRKALTLYSMTPVDETPDRPLMAKPYPRSRLR